LPAKPVILKKVTEPLWKWIWNWFAFPESQIINLFLSSFHPDRIPILKSGKNTCQTKYLPNLWPF